MTVPSRTASAVTTFGRALRRRCPHCGGGPAFVSWIRMLPNCPVCGLRFERGERGYWLGAYFFNLMAMETVFLAWILGALAWTWPDTPWSRLEWETVALMLVMPIAFYPFSKTLFLAFDHIVRPVTDEDFGGPVELGRRSLRGPPS